MYIGAMKIAIIGAGCAGLVSARYCLKNNLSCVVYEQTDKLGGVWNYTEKTGSEDNGIPIHTVMYEDLRTNLPKQLMSYYDFPYPEEGLSFLTQLEVLSYMQRYAEHFKLLPVIKFYKQILSITPFNNKWKITLLDLKTKQNETIDDYDAVLVCNGHYHKISMPDIEGMDTFTGFQMHSNIYRNPQRFAGLKVLVIGAGPSGQDISSKIAGVGEKVFLSHRFSGIVRVSPKVVQKPVVKKIAGNEIIFDDDSKEVVDAIVYCTGYKYDYPFLDKNCGIECDGNSIKYLYKHIINVEYPTMGFIGVCNQICPFPVSDVQVQFFLATLLGRCPLKSKAEMVEEIKNAIKNKLVGKQIHRIAEEQQAYCDDLARMGKFKSLPPVLQDLYEYVRKNRNTEDCFKILDDNNYVKIDCNE
ncbi:hypothetical protein Trydic_g22216 [Trypoxylus dichotomus]